jgi:hypothetical protein
MIVARPHPLEIAVIDWDAVNRPQVPMPSPDEWVVHEVGNQNPGADEFMHRNYIHNGAPPGRVSYHFVTGNHATIQLIYANEAAWHSGDYQGNYNGIGHEHIQVGDFDLTLAHGTFTVADFTVHPERYAFNPAFPRGDDLHPANVRSFLSQHAFHMVKNCPEFIRNGGLWDEYIEAVVAQVVRFGVKAAGKYKAPAIPDNYQSLIDKGEDFTYNGTFWKSVKTVVTPRRAIIPRAWASGPQSRTAIEGKFTAYYVGHPDNNQRKPAYVLTKQGHRVMASHVSPYLGGLV